MASYPEQPPPSAPQRQAVPGWVGSIGQVAPAVAITALCWLAGQLWELKLQQTKMAQLLEQLSEQAATGEQRDREGDRMNTRQDQQIQRLLIRTNLER